MPDKMNNEITYVKGMRYRFHPLVRLFMLALSMLTAGYCIYFIAILIPGSAHATIFFKIISVIVLYVSLSTIYNHLTGLNAVVIFDDRIDLRFLIRKRISITWDRLLSMSIYKVVTHYWKITYRDLHGNQRTFKTSLAFPGIMNILISIYDKKPDIELNELLKQVILFKQKTKDTTPLPNEVVSGSDLDSNPIPADFIDVTDESKPIDTKPDATE